MQQHAPMMLMCIVQSVTLTYSYAYAALSYPLTKEIAHSKDHLQSTIPNNDRSSLHAIQMASLREIRRVK